MKTLLIRPTDFKAQGRDNLYVNPLGDTSQAVEEHEAIATALTDPVVAVVRAPLPDMVFVSDSGITLVGLPQVILLSRMKYKGRREEQPFHLQIFKKLGFRTIPFPKGVFEGQSELKFFRKGAFAVHGYGFRSTRASTEVMQQVLIDIYQKYKIRPPVVVPIRLIHPLFYHLDIAMLKYSETECIVHRRAFTEKDIERLRHVCTVHVIDVSDTLCLNAVVDGGRLLTRAVSPQIKRTLEKITGYRVVPLSTHSFEQAGGSVRCTVFEL
jgi:N-dimethylarginine dimethylaminohydrolase